MGGQGSSHTVLLAATASDLISEIGENRDDIIHFCLHDGIASKGLEILFIIFPIILQGRRRKLSK